MNIKTLSFGCAVLTASMVQAATVDFPNAGGDLASAADWGGTLPASSEDVSIRKSGTYRLSDDVSFSSLKVSGDSLDVLLDFKSDGNHVFTDTRTSGSTWATFANGANSKTVMRGGRYVLAGDCNLAFNQSYASSVLITDGAEVVCEGGGDFAAGNYGSGSKTVVSNATVKADIIDVAANGGSGHTLEVREGGKVYATARFYSSKGGTAGTAGGNTLLVSGDGALFQYTGGYSFVDGFNHPDDQVIVENHGIIDAEGKTVQLGGVNAPRSHLIVGENGSFTAGTVTYNGSDSTVAVTNGSFAVGTKFSVANGTESGNRAVFSGSGSSLTLPQGDWFGTGAGNEIVFADGCRFAVACNLMMVNTHDSLMKVTGEGTVFGDVGKNFYVGSMNESTATTSACASNRVVVADGAEFRAARFCLSGLANELIVSNATLQIGEDSAGLRIGYSIRDNMLATNNVLTLAGRAPQVKVDASAGNNACLFAHGATLRFIVPKEGFDPSQPVFDLACAFAPDATTKILIDCEDFAKAVKTNGTLHLVRTGVDLAKTVTGLLDAIPLPPKCRIVRDKRNVYLKVPKNTGMMLMLR